MKKLFALIKNFFTDFAEFAEVLIEGVKTIVESFASMFKWIPQVLTFANGNFLNFIPLAFAGVVTVVVVIFLLKLVLGGSNK